MEASAGREAKDVRESPAEKGRRGGFGGSAGEVTTYLSDGGWRRSTE